MLATPAGADAGPGAVSAQFGFGTPFFEQIEFFKRKLNLPTERWDDITGAAHDRAFIVAGAGTADLLQDLRQAVDSTMASGGGLGEFRRKFKSVVAANGWTGWTGEGSTKGEAWRTRIIYQTNMATSYAAGRYKQLTDPAFVKLRPYWEYVHADGQLHPRPLHLAWNGITLPNGHPFWKTHFAPNGWGCRCEIHAVAKPAAGARTTPPDGWDQPDPNTGAPPGIDNGFAYAPGANAATPLRELVKQKLFRLDAPIGAQMWQALNPALLREAAADFGQWVAAVRAAGKPVGETFLVSAMPPELVAQLEALRLAPATANIVVRDEDVLHTFRPGKQNLLPADWYAQLPTLMDQPRAVVLDTTVADKPALLYLFDLPGETAKMVLTLDYQVWRR